jgi:Spy/CpxP family protein refolding chaperone
MNMKTRIWTTAVFIIVTVLLAGSPPAWAGASAPEQAAPQWGFPPLARLVAGNIGRLLVLGSELNVTPDQRAKIAGIVKSHRAEITPTVRDVLEKKIALRDAVLNERPEEKVIRSAAADLAKTVGDASVLASKVIGEVRAILTPDQIERIRKVRKENEQAARAWTSEIGKFRD